MHTVIIDTNMLLVPGQFNVDVFAEIDRICSFQYELVVVPETVTELRELAMRDDKQGTAAKMALQLIKKYGVRSAAYRKVFKRADEAILEIACNDVIVVTQDRELRKAVHDRGGRTIVLRQKKYLVLE